MPVFKCLTSVLGQKHKMEKPVAVEGISNTKGVAKKLLAVFDFDHTIIDANSDTYVDKLAPSPGDIPEEIQTLHTVSGWTSYMREVFRYLHKHGTKPDDILNCMAEIKLVDGMDKVFEFLKSHASVIIISDSNSVFIDHILKTKGLEVDAVFTNPAKFQEDGLLTIEMYHEQHWCDLSTKNLCKGYILEEYVKNCEKDGVKFDCIAYVGDGRNDFCPALKLVENDRLFPREGYTLIKMLSSPVNAEKVKAKILPWSNGHSLLALIQKECFSVENDI